MRDQTADKYIRGNGIECGGLHCPVKVRPGVSVTYVDVPKPEHDDVVSKIKDWVHDDIHYLRNFESSSLDFVIANHVLEHCENFYQALSSCIRVLVSGGIFYCALPEMTKTFDKNRRPTNIRHHLNEYFLPARTQNEIYEHYYDYYRYVDNMDIEKAHDHALISSKTRPNIHFHCWDKNLMRSVFECGRYLFPYSIIEEIENGTEMIWILKKL